MFKRPVLAPSFLSTKKYVYGMSAHFLHNVNLIHSVLTRLVSKKWGNVPTLNLLLAKYNDHLCRPGEGLWWGAHFPWCPLPPSLLPPLLWRPIPPVVSPQSRSAVRVIQSSLFSIWSAAAVRDGIRTKDSGSESFSGPEYHHVADFFTDEHFLARKYEAAVSETHFWSESCVCMLRM